MRRSSAIRAEYVLITPAVPLIVAALRDKSDPDGYLNCNAADALGQIGPAAAAGVPELIGALHSDNLRLVTRAITALGNIGAPAQTAIPALVDAMRRDPEHKDYKAEAIGQIAQALALRGDRSCLNVLRAAYRAEVEEGIGLADIDPLREAIDDLSRSRPLASR